MSYESGSLSRRDFLKLSAAAAIGALAFRPTLSLLDVEGRALKEEIFFKMVDGVEVFGLSAPIDTKEKMLDLTRQMDDEFMRVKDPDDKLVESGYNYDELRDILLPKNERYLTMVVKRSVYESYTRNIEKTGVSYPTWVRNFVDLSNRMLSASIVPTKAHVSLRRIIVVDDSFDGENIKSYPMIDTDAMWFQDLDYRFGADRPSFMWKYQQKDDGSILFFRETDDEGDYEEPVSFPTETRDSLNDQKYGEVDVGIIHEIVNHMLFSNDDSYTRNIDQEAFGDVFRIGGWYMQKPVIPAEIVMVINENIKRGVRGYYTDPLGIGRVGLRDFYLYGLMQDKIEVQFTAGQGLEIHESWYPREEGGDDNKHGPYYRSEVFHQVYTDSTFDGKFSTSSIDSYFGKRYDPEEGEFTPLTYLFRVKIGSEYKNLFFPRLLFNLAHVSGSRKEVCFNIDLHDVPNMYVQVSQKTQEMSFVKQEDFEAFKRKLWDRRDPLVASMDFPNTNLVCVWYYTKKI